VMQVLLKVVFAIQMSTNANSVDYENISDGSVHRLTHIKSRYRALTPCEMM